MESKSDFIRMAATVAVVAIAVYLALTFLMPHKEAAPENAGVSADQVFASKADPNAPPPTATASAASSGGETTGSPPLNEPEARKIGEEVGRQVATQVAQNVVNNEMAKQAPPTESAPAPVTPAPAQNTSAESSTSAAPASPPPPAETAVSAPVSSSAATPPPAESSTAAAPPPSEPTASEAAAPEPKPAKAPKAPKHTDVAASEPAKPAHRPAGHSSKTSADHAAEIKAPPASEALTAWWAGSSGGGITVPFVGQAAGEPALVIVLSSNADAASAGSHIQVSDSSGKPLSLSWEAGTSPHVLVARHLTAGRYTVVIAPELADAGGKTLGTALHGPIYIH